MKFSIKTFLPRTLFGRSLLILIVPVLLIQIITAFMFFDRHWSKMTSRLAYGVAGEISLITRAVEKISSPFELENLSRHAAQDLAFIIDFQPGAALGEDHKISAVRVWDSMVAQSLIAELRNALNHPFIVDIDFHEKWVRVSIGLENGVLNIALPGRRLFSSSGYIFLLWMIGSSLLLLMIAILFMRGQIRPILKLAVAAERFGKGREISSFKPGGAKEVRQAAQAFIDMHRRIRRQVEQRTAMLAGVSHDLRTPLTRMKLQLEMMGDNSDIQAMKSDVQEMQKMIEGYLEFVRGEGDEPVLYTDFNLLLGKVTEAAARQNITVTKNSDPEIHVMLRPMAFERCLTNLVSNAGKYGTHVWIEAHIEDDKLRITVEDDGPGIPEDQYEEVFKPFYRVDTSRNLQTGGVGLGLPIAMDIVHAHGGKIWLEKSVYGGLKAVIRVPL